jgi:copper chaperone
MSTTFKVKGMTCGGCAKSIESAIASVSIGAKAKADPATGLVVVEGASAEQVAKAVDEAGFEFVGEV